MTAAETKSRAKSDVRLMVMDTKGRIERISHVLFSELPLFLSAGDVLVVNDAATLPASLPGRHLRTGEPVEMRLAGALSPEKDDPSRWRVILFGEGSWRTPTEKRKLAPSLQKADLLLFGRDLRAEVSEVDPIHPRLAEIRFLGEAREIWDALYREGRPVQYSHLREDLALWDVQTLFSGKPVSVEAPSAAFPLSWGIVQALDEKGVGIAMLTHSAGLSSTGDLDLDSRLPFPERYWIPEDTAAQVNRARAEGRRVIALGTTVTRALESSAQPAGRVASGAGIAHLKMTPEFKRNVVSGILSGFHEDGASHLKLLGSFVAPQNLAKAYREAEGLGYLCHEFGDSCLILGQPLEATKTVSAFAISGG